MEDSKKKWAILSVMSISLGMTFIDMTAVAIALPKIQLAFYLSQSTLQWVNNAYLLVLAVFLILGGYLGDKLSHQRAMISGLIIFIIASILCAIAPEKFWLISSRAIQGFGAALMIPNAAVMIINAFPHHEKGKAMGIYMGSSLLFLPLALLIGGLFTEYFSWRLIFWINVPLGIICLLGLKMLTHSIVYVPISKKFDWRGFIFLSIGISTLVIGLMESPNYKNEWYLIGGLLLTSIISLIIFYFVEKQESSPIVDFSIYKNKLVLSATILFFTTSGSNALFIYDAIFFQEVLGKSPAEAGLLFFPNVLCVMLAAPFAGKMLDKFGYKIPIFTGLILCCVGLILKASLASYGNYWLLLPGIILFNIGIPFVLTSSNAAALISVGEKKRGITSGILSATRQISNSVSLAILTAIIVGSNFFFLRSFLQKNQDIYPDLTPKDLERFLIDHQGTVLNSNQPQIQHLYQVTKQSFTWAYSLGLYATSFIILGAFIGVFFLFRKEPAIITELKS
ncbi:MAG: MFS transporter [Gammaproteobacteria bacterium]|nr:MFS transporter [Gammaproteobacteria bacterium]